MLKNKRKGPLRLNEGVEPSLTYRTTIPSMNHVTDDGVHLIEYTWYCSDTSNFWKMYCLFSAFPSVKKLLCTIVLFNGVRHTNSKSISLCFPGVSGALSNSPVYKKNAVTRLPRRRISRSPIGRGYKWMHKFVKSNPARKRWWVAQEHGNLTCQQNNENLENYG